MPIMYNTGDWFILQPDSYRKVDLNMPDWPLDLELDYMQVAGAPFGGPLAVIRDPQKIVPVKGSSKPTIRILDTAGNEMAQIMWNHGKLIAMGWSDNEELVCVQEDAHIYVYDMFGQEKSSHTIGSEANAQKIVDAKIYRSQSGTGVAAMTTTGRIVLRLINTKDYHTRQLPELPRSSSECSSWEIITQDLTTYCLLGRDQEILKLCPGETVAITRNLIEKPYDRLLLMSSSYNYQSLALYTNTGVLWLGSVDMKHKYCEIDTGRKDVPRQMEWIMDPDSQEAVALALSYPSYLLVVNRNGDSNLFAYDPTIFLIPEIDGLRILTHSTHEILQKLPKSVQNIFAINSQEPSSFLFEAQKKFQEGSHQADEYLGLIRGKMGQAVDECIQAAAYEFCPETQKSLLRTAYFGKGFIAGHNPAEYIRIMRILRVLNALRHPKIAMPLTYYQFMHLKADVILSRLVSRKHYAIAIQVAKHLKLPESWILEHWAYHKVLNDKNDQEVARKIVEKFKKAPIDGISFCNIAEKAHEAGRDELALKLVELESRAELQVPLLLKLNKHNQALQSATQSGDTELVTMVLLKIKQNMMLGNFHVLIRRHPMALNVYKKIIQSWSRTALYDIYNTEDDYRSLAEYNFRSALDTDSLEPNLPVITNNYTMARKNVEADLCSDTAKLMKLQKSLTNKYASAHDQIQFYGLSLHDTIEQLLGMSELREAEKIKNDFKVPDKRYWWLRIRALASKYKWEDLEKFAKSRKSPIGYEPFVEVCLKQKNLHEARKYIAKCKDERKLHWNMRAELYEEAAENAFELRDEHTLQILHKKANAHGHRLLLDKVNYYLATMAAKK